MCIGVCMDGYSIQYGLVVPCQLDEAGCEWSHFSYCYNGLHTYHLLSPKPCRWTSSSALMQRSSRGRESLVESGWSPLARTYSKVSSWMSRESDEHESDEHLFIRSYSRSDELGLSIIEIGFAATQGQIRASSRVEAYRAYVACTHA